MLTIRRNTTKRYITRCVRRYYSFQKCNTCKLQNSSQYSSLNPKLANGNELTSRKHSPPRLSFTYELKCQQIQKLIENNPNDICFGICWQLLVQVGDVGQSVGIFFSRWMGSAHHRKQVENRCLVVGIFKTYVHQKIAYI